MIYSFFLLGSGPPSRLVLILQSPHLLVGRSRCRPRPVSVSASSRCSLNYACYGPSSTAIRKIHRWRPAISSSLGMTPGGHPKRRGYGWPPSVDLSDRCRTWAVASIVQRATARSRNAHRPRPATRSSHQQMRALEDKDEPRWRAAPEEKEAVDLSADPGTAVAS